MSRPPQITRVNACLIELGITQCEAAEDIGTGGPAVSNLANNKGVLLADGHTFSGPAKRLAEYLDRPPEWLWADLQEEFGTHPHTQPSGLLLGVADDRAGVEDLYAREAEISRLTAAMDAVLSERQRIVLRERYGLPGAQQEGVPRSLSEVGQMMAVSRERVRQMENEAIIRLRVHGRLRDDLWREEGEDFVALVRERAELRGALDEVDDDDLGLLKVAARRPIVGVPGTVRLVRLGLLRQATRTARAHLYEATPRGRAVLLAQEGRGSTRSPTPTCPATSERR